MRGKATNCGRWSQLNTHKEVNDHLQNGGSDINNAPVRLTGALKITSPLVLSLRQAFIHHNPRNLQPEPFRHFFHADGEPLKLKAGYFHDRAAATRHQDTATHIPVRAKRMHRHRAAVNEVSPVWLHHCNLLLLAFIRMWVRTSTSGIRRDEVSMSRLSVSCLHS